MKKISSKHGRNNGFEPSSLSNSKTKSTIDSTGMQMQTNSTLNHAGESWQRNYSGTRNSLSQSKKQYALSHGMSEKKLRKSDNFTSADLKSQYLTHAGVHGGTPGKKISKKPPMHHSKLAKESGDRSGRNKKSSKISKPGSSGGKPLKLPAKAILEMILQGQQPNIDILDLRLPNEESTKYSSKRNGIICGYAANTNQGIIRTYNEDRVSIILNIVKPKGKEHVQKWPKCSFFAIYDGHGGNV